jgi:hypothetical protein
VSSLFLKCQATIIYTWTALPQRPITIYATMRRARSFIVSTLFAFASAQVGSTSKFTNPWLTDYVVGTTYQISWTVGDDRPVSLTISNSTWSVDLACEFENSSGEPFWSLTCSASAFLPPQTTTSFNWTVPPSLHILSSYTMSLSQNGPNSDFSPPFTVLDLATPQTTLQPQSTTPNATTAMNGTLLTLTPGCTEMGAAVARPTNWDTR